MTYDWVHTLLQQGVMNAEIEGLLIWSSGLGISREAVQAFLKDEAWAFPNNTRHLARQLHRIFDVSRVSSTKPDKIRGTCSELLGVYGMLRLTLAVQCVPQLLAAMRLLTELTAYRLVFERHISDLLACHLLRQSEKGTHWTTR